MLKFANRPDKGFTLVEMLVTVVIVVLVASSIIQLLIVCSRLSEFSWNMTSAMNQIQNKMEEIRNDTYSLITTDYASGGTPGNTFALTNPPGMGVIYIDSSNANLLKIDISASWQVKNRRFVGEDTDLDGTLDAGEDKNANGRIDSPVQLITYVYRTQ